MKVQALEIPGKEGETITIPPPTGDNITQGGLLSQGDLSLANLINAAVPLIFWIAGIALFGYLIYGGFRFLTSLGDEGAVEQAKGTITNALLGFLIILAAYFLAQFLGNLFATGTF